MPRSDPIIERLREALRQLGGMPLTTAEERVAFLRGYVSFANRFFLERRSPNDIDNLNAPHPDHPQWERITPFLAIWDDYAEEVLGLCFDDGQIDALAQALASGFRKSPIIQNRPTPIPPDVCDPSLGGFTPRQFALLRLMHALQDFSETLPLLSESLAEEVRRRMPGRQLPTETLLADPCNARALVEAFGGADRNVDERVRYIHRSAEHLLGVPIRGAYEVAEYCAHDVPRILEFLRRLPGMKTKKSLMIVRDFYEMGVWTIESGLQELHVIPDNRVMRLALRTGILNPSLGKLLNSLLDEFDFQYGLVVAGTIEAFRRVWERTARHNGGTPIAPFPAKLDEFLFNLGDGRIGCCKPGKPVCITGKRPRSFHEWLEQNHGWSCQHACPLLGVCPERTRKRLAPYAIQNNTWVKIFTDCDGGGGLRGV